MDFTIADRIWNRAAVELGGNQPEAGDRALADLLLLHNLVMNGGVHHAINTLGPFGLAAAVAGYSFFGLDDVALFLRGDPTLCEWTDDTEVAANRRYSAMVPDDAHLFRCFERVLREHPGMFAPAERGQ